MEVDFGDSELFEQFESDTPVAKHIRFTNDDEEEEEEQAPDLRERIEEHEETITRLKTENILHTPGDKLNAKLTHQPSARGVHCAREP